MEAYFCIYVSHKFRKMLNFPLKGTLKWSAIFLYMKEGSILIKKIKSKIAAEPSFSFKLAEKVGKFVLLWQK